MLPRAQPLPTHAEPSDPEVGFTWFAEISARVVHTSCREHLRSLPASGCGMLRAIIPKNAEGAQFLLLDMHVALKRRPSRRSGHFERDAALPVLTSCCYGPHEHRCACQRLMPHPGGREWLAHVECPCRMVPNSRSMPRLLAQYSPVTRSLSARPDTNGAKPDVCSSSYSGARSQHRSSLLPAPPGATPHSESPFCEPERHWSDDTTTRVKQHARQLLVASRDACHCQPCGQSPKLPKPSSWAQSSSEPVHRGHAPHL